MNLLVQWRTLHTRFDEYENTFRKNRYISILSGSRFSQANSKLNPQPVAVAASEDTSRTKKRKYVTFFLRLSFGVIILTVAINKLCE